jgi:hypothetical protein
LRAADLQSAAVTNAAHNPKEGEILSLLNVHFGQKQQFSAINFAA